MIQKPAWVVVALLCLPAVSAAQTQTTEQQAIDRSRIGWFKVVGGSLATSIGLGLVAAGNTPDPFTGDKSKGQMTLGVAMTGGGAFLLWQGMQDIHSARRAPSIGIAVTPKAARVVYRRSA